ncbi:MAG: helix-turn-helix domain-containing protein [Victivallaceae bacterium]|nr:AraC family transcriptional regulator [Victivallaceae bacterium]
MKYDDCSRRPPLSEAIYTPEDISASGDYKSGTVEEFNDIFFPSERDALTCMLLHCGHMLITRHDYRWSGLLRGNVKFTIWQYTLAGEGALELGKERYTIKPGQAMLLEVPEDHVYLLPESSPQWEFLYVSLYGPEPVRLQKEFRRRHGSICEFAPDSLVVKMAYELLRRSRSGEIFDCYSASAAAYEFILEMCASVGGHNRQDTKLLRRIHDYCLAHIQDRISVDELAELAGCTRWHFSRRFKELSGYSPHDYVLDLKMRKAVRLLQSTNAPVKEIAYSCGFDNPEYFSRVFYRIYHTFPREFRNGNARDIDWLGDFSEEGR